MTRAFMIAVMLLIPPFAAGAETYSGTARDSRGAIAYLENHKVTRSKEGRVNRSETEYSRPSGEVFGRLVSDFSRSLTAPSYTFSDARDGSEHGLEQKGDRYVMWKKAKNGKREEKEIARTDFNEDTLVVGCQGLHYYLVDNLETVSRRKVIPIKYLIPGKLDYYSFTLRLEKEDADLIHMKVRVENLILRAFVSSLELTYRKKDGRLIAYKGLSNIAADDGGIQNVSIAYDAPGGNGPTEVRP
jgi:hypothetical protein